MKKRGLEECYRQIGSTRLSGWEYMRSDDGKRQMGKGLVLKDLVCKRLLLFLAELGCEVLGERLINAHCCGIYSEAPIPSSSTSSRGLTLMRSGIHT